MTQRDVQKQETRRYIIRTALLLFGENGILGTRTIDIARAAGISHGSIFAHFPTRDDLVASVIGTFGEQAIRRIHDHVGRNAPLHEVLETHLDSIKEYEALYTKLVVEGPLLSPLTRSTLVGIQSAISLHLARAARREMHEGTIKHIEIPLLFNTWIGLIHHYLINSDLFAPGESVLEKHGRILVEHYMELLAP